MKIKDCPFCGGKAEVIQDSVSKKWHVSCHAPYNEEGCCEACTQPYTSMEDAVEAWNIRVLDQVTFEYTKQYCEHIVRGKFVRFLMEKRLEDFEVNKIIRAIENMRIEDL